MTTPRDPGHGHVHELAPVFDWARDWGGALLLAGELEELEWPEEYCDLCEVDGHTFRTCPARDDELEELEP